MIKGYYIVKELWKVLKQHTNTSHFVVNSQLENERLVELSE